MYRANQGLLGVIGLTMLLFLAPCAFGQGSVGINMNSGGPYVMNGVYVGAYGATVNGQAAQIICDDWADDTYLNESWTANVTNFSNLGTSKTMWSGKPGATTLYADAAWLATQMLAPANQNTNTQGYLAYSLWSLFNTNALSGLGSSQLKGVNNWLSQIPSGLTPSQFANFFIYTPDLSKSITCGGGACATAPPQEFLGFISAPEGGAALLYLLLAAASCFGAIVLQRRRQAIVAGRELA